MKVKKIKVIGTHNFEAAYKKKTSGKLVWFSCYATNAAEANKKMDSFINNVYQNEGYRRYAGSLPIKSKS